MRSGQILIVILLMLLAAKYSKGQDLWLGAQGGIAYSDIPNSIENFLTFRASNLRSLSGGFELNGSINHNWFYGAYFNHFSYDIGYEYAASVGEYLVTWNIYSKLTNEVGLNGGYDLHLGKSRIGCLIGAGAGIMTGFGEGITWTRHQDDSLDIEVLTMEKGKKSTLTVLFKTSCYYQFTNGMKFTFGPTYSVSISNVADSHFKQYNTGGFLLSEWNEGIRPSSIRFLVGLHYPISRIWRGKEGIE